MLRILGASRWKSKTKTLVDALEAARNAPKPRRFDHRELDGLPAPVQRYFRAVLEDGQPMIQALHMNHSGRFNMSESEESWKSFTSKQQVILQRPGFVWDAKIQMLPGLIVRVHDAYIAGEGLLNAALFGLLSVVNLRGTPEMAHGELMRFFAEATWYPTALLPSQGVRWEGVDKSSAKAILQDGDIVLQLTFSFNTDHLIETVYAEARARNVDGSLVATPWLGRFWNYERQHGICIPRDGEVAWLLPEGPKPYWRGHLEDITYEFES